MPHRRQYLGDRAGETFYDQLRWRSHAAKYSAACAQSLRHAIEYAVVGKRGTTSVGNARRHIKLMTAGWPLWRCWSLWIRIALARIALRFRKTTRGAQPRYA